MSDTQPQPTGSGMTAAQDAVLAPAPRSCSAERGLAWLREGWAYFRRAPLIWVAITVVFGITLLFVAWAPVIGQLVTTLLSIVFAGGMMTGCRALDRGESLRLSHLFAVFTTHLSPLLVVGALYVAALFSIIVIVSLVTGGALAGLLHGDMAPAGALTGVMFALLAAATILIPLGMATWFAPALVTLHDLAPVDAMKLSFRGCWRNVLAFLVYGVLGFLLAVVASIPAGLGWLVLVPVLAASAYAGYKDIFLEA